LSKAGNGSLDVNLFVARLAASFPAIRSIWSIGEPADARPEEGDTAVLWALLAFADERTLDQLRSAIGLHHLNVTLSVITDGDRFERAWGHASGRGSLSRWNWIEADRNEAFYSQAIWSNPAESRLVERVRRKAICLWRTQEHNA
jgi:hypothetical protein